jgi:hypothetical protein
MVILASALLIEGSLNPLLLDDLGWWYGRVI